MNEHFYDVMTRDEMIASYSENNIHIGTANQSTGNMKEMKKMETLKQAAQNYVQPTTKNIDQTPHLLPIFEANHFNLSLQKRIDGESCDYGRPNDQNLQLSCKETLSQWKIRLRVRTFLRTYPHPTPTQSQSLF